jgi:LuxR family maltose regulon positive regulatory protein
MLEALERGNLFVVPLDDKRQWYRYHHLFADVLQARLMEEQLHQVPTLHLRASEWYEQNDLSSNAIRHALAAEDFERAAGLIELAWPAMDSSFQTATWLGWARALPDELVRVRPVLSVGYAWSLLNVGELEAGEIRLRDAERWLEASEIGKKVKIKSTEMVVVDKEQFRTLPATIASARTYYSQALGDIPGSVKYARQALDLLPADDYFGRGRMAVLLGLTYWSSGDLEAAHRSFTDAMASFQKVGNILFAISFTFILADISLAQGRLNEAISIYQRSIKLAKEHGERLQGTADLYLGLSELYREQGDQEAARQHLLRSEELDDQTEVYQYHLCRARAHMKQSQGDWNAALDQLDEAERWLYYQNPIPDVRSTAALKARVWIEQGRQEEALAWAQERDLSIDDDLSYLREFEHATLARVLIARYINERDEHHIQDAVRLLERLLQAAEDGGRRGSMLEILVLQALAHQAQGDIPSALVSLERALKLAEPEGYVRVFIEEGQPMANLLSVAAARGILPDYTGKLLAFFEAEAQKSKEKSHLSSDQPLIEPLSERELEVLQLIAQGLSNREICERLFLAMSTVKGHNRRIFGKLEVQRRTEAIARARELGLL